MKNAKPTPREARALRQRAEQKLREHRALAEQPPSEVDARALVHELRVHQIELEMQNEELRRAEAQALEAVEKYTDLFDFAPLGYFQLTQDGVIREANLAGAALLGLDRSRVVFQRFGAWVAPACLQTFGNFLKAVLVSDTKQTCEIRLLGEGPAALDVQLEGLAAPPHHAELEKTWSLTVLDVTPRKQAEVELRQSERLYRAIGESIDYGVWVCAPDGRNIYASPSFLNLVGITQEHCSNFGWGDVLHPEDAARTLAAWKECVRTDGTWDIEHRFRGVDGQWHPILARGVPVRDEHGTVTCWAGINLDISRLKQAEEALRESRERLDLALVSSRMATFDWDIIKNKRAWSHGVHALLGTKPGTFTGAAEEFFQIIHPEDRSAVQSALARAVETTGEYETEYRAVWPDGSIRHISVRGKVHRDSAGRAVQMTGVCWDITAHKLAETEIRRRAEELRAANDELTRFNRVTVGRELRIIELKKQVNDLCARLGQPPRYATELDEEARPAKS